jgi:biopolymer transport protein ExbD
MKLRRSGQSGANVENKVDMTPLIDIIFQLILFLVLTSQITVQTEDVDLPFALEGKESPPPGAEDSTPLIVNVVRYALSSDEGPRSGSIVFEGHKLDKKSLTAKLKQHVRHDASPTGRGRGYEAFGSKDLSKLSVLVRADKGVRGEYLRAVWQACMDAGIYKVKVSTVQPE